VAIDIEKDFIQRAARKDEHIEMFLKTFRSGNNGFQDVVLQNNALPETNFGDVSTECHFLRKIIGMPMMINAMTGGTDYTYRLNRQLALLAREFCIPIAVGSQAVALQKESSCNSFQIVRRLYPQGIVIANLSAGSSYEDICQAVEMISADAIQLHLNVPHEISMKEGERCFAGILQNIQENICRLKIPVIVKEVGFGISYETARKLYHAGVKYIDIGGRGGTNFIDIEAARNPGMDYSFLRHWGISTAQSLLECRNVSRDLTLICSGGLTKGEEICKALVMGAGLTGISGLVLKALLEEGYDAAKARIAHIQHQLKVIMLLLGAGEIEKLSKTTYLLKGELHQLYKQKFT
jgi:isopentenyl-diphosphate delta-isomerase